jgi:hypothetical protein
MVVLAVVGVMVVGFGIAAFILLSGGEQPPVDAKPKAEAVKPASSKAASSRGLGVTGPPPPRKDVLKKLNDLLDPLSSKVDALERRKLAAEKIEDPEKRLPEIEKLQDEFAAIADEIEEVLARPEFVKFRDDPDQRVYFEGYYKRPAYYGDRLRDLKKQAAAARTEIAVRNAKAKKPS